MRPLALLLSLVLAFQPGRALAQALNEAADLAGSAGMGDRRFDGALKSRSPSDGVTAGESLSSKKTLEPPAIKGKEAKKEPPPIHQGLDLDGPGAKRGRVKGALLGGTVGAATGAILGWAIFGSLFGIIGLAVVAAVAAGAIGQDAGRHCGADPECG